eukprot:6187037-Pyramimonas_sp.AAC.1
MALSLEPVADDECYGWMADWECASGRAPMEEWAVEQRRRRCAGATDIRASAPHGHQVYIKGPLKTRLSD